MKAQDSGRELHLRCGMLRLTDYGESRPEEQAAAAGRSVSGSGGLVKP